LVPAKDTFSRATPSQIVQRVAGMAFNFSTVQLPAVSTRTPEAAPHRDAHRITFRTRRVMRDLSRPQQAVML